MIMSDEHSQQMMQFIDKSILRTPNLDRLAKKSTVFTNCYSPCPVCAPARASFFTGQYVNRLGTWDNSTPYDGTVEGMAQYLKKNGVDFTCIGKTHFHHAGEYGFKEEFEAGYMQTPDIGCYFRQTRRARLGAEKRFEKIGIDESPKKDDRLLEYALNWLDGNYQNNNWVMYVGFSCPHFPFYVKQEHWNYYESKIHYVPDILKPPFSSLNEPLEWLRTYFKCEDVPEETVRKALIGYCCVIEELDTRIGAILDKMDSLGIADNSTFIYTSDHGEQLGYHGMWWKCTMFDESANVPLIIRTPNVEPRFIDHPVNLVDIYPTLCDICSMDTPKNIDGKSLYPLMKQEKETNLNDFTFSEFHAHGIPDGMFMIRWRQYKYVYFTYYKAQLFDMENDPHENNSLIPEGYVPPEIAKIVAECHKRLMSVCNPYEVDARVKDFQERMKEKMGLNEYKTEKGNWVPFPENVLK